VEAPEGTAHGVDRLELVAGGRDEAQGDAEGALPLRARVGHPVEALRAVGTLRDLPRGERRGRQRTGGRGAPRASQEEREAEQREDRRGGPPGRASGFGS